MLLVNPSTSKVNFGTFGKGCRHFLLNQQSYLAVFVWVVLHPHPGQVHIWKTDVQIETIRVQRLTRHNADNRLAVSPLRHTHTHIKTRGKILTSENTLNPTRQKEWVFWTPQNLSWSIVELHAIHFQSLLRNIPWKSTSMLITLLNQESARGFLCFNHPTIQKNLNYCSRHVFKRVFFLTICLYLNFLLLQFLCVSQSKKILTFLFFYIKVIF